MAKRNKVRFPSKGRKSALRIEALEQRQLLAAVSGGGTEVGSDIKHANGNVYDQVLMNGASVTVGADAGQVTRVSFLDVNGDIVQAEFSGKGTLTIALDSATFKDAAVPANYNQDVKYVQGAAGFTIQGSDATTNFSVFSVGPGNAVNQDLFAGGKTGGTNHIADVSYLRIVSDPANPGGFSNFGGIRAGNAIFSGSTGTVGIAAANVQVQGPVIVGDVDASATGVPTLNFGQNSQFSSLTVAGGDLAQTNNQNIVSTGGGAAIGFQSVNFTAGATSLVESRTGFTAGSADMGAKTSAAPGWTTAPANTATLDSTSSIDITGKTQAQINDLFSGRTFTSAVTVAGDLAVTNSISATAFQGGVTFTGDLSGTVTVTKTAGNVAAKSIAGAFTADTIGSLTVTNNVSAEVNARTIGDVSVGGDLTALITTDTDDTNTYTGTEGAIGNVTITGSVGTGGGVEGILGIGNISVGKNITSALNAAGTAVGVFSTQSGTSGDSYLGNIGTLTVTGDIDQGGTTVPVINIGKNGTFGNVTVGGAGTLTTTTEIGLFQVVGSLGSSTVSTGTISITETTTPVEFGGVAVGASTVGSVGALTITGAGTTSATFELKGTISPNAALTTGDITVSGFQSITTSAAIIAKGAAVSFTTNAGTTSTNSLIDIKADIGSLATDIGNITLNAGAANSTVKFGNGGAGEIVADDMKDVTITAKTVSMDVTAGKGLEADNTVGNITINGALNTSAASINLGTKATSSFTVTGAAALTGGQTFGSITGALTLSGGSTWANGSQIAVAGSVGSISLGGTTDMSANATTSILLNDSTSARDTIGSITVTGRILGNAGTTDIKASSIGDISISSALTQDQALITDLNIVAAPNAGTTFSNAEQITLDGANLANYAIGNITVSSSLALAFTGTKLFSGDNSFVALGKIGNISVTGAVSGAQQTRLFNAATDAAWFAVGDTDGLTGNTTADLASTYNISGTTATATPNWTAGTVSVGNVTVNTAQTTTTGSYSGVDNIGGSAAASAGMEGFAVLAGVRVAAANGDLITLGAAGASAVNPVDIDAELKGTVGDVLISSNQAVGFLDEVTTATLVGTAGEKVSGIIAATSIGKAQSVTTVSGLNAAGEAAIIGDTNATVDDTVEATGDSPNQIVVVIV